MQLPEFIANTKLWIEALEMRHGIQAAPAVYAILHSEKFGRLIGESSILYIGHTGQLGGTSQTCRLRIYRYPGGTHAREIRTRTNALLDTSAELTFAWGHVGSRAEARELESKLLAQYAMAHGELPPFNSRI